jgi:hypothetical protein
MSKSDSAVVATSSAATIATYRRSAVAEPRVAELRAGRVLTPVDRATDTLGEWLDRPEPGLCGLLTATSDPVVVVLARPPRSAAQHQRELHATA